MQSGYELAKEFRDDAAKETRLARIEELETAVLEQSAQVVQAILAFSEISPQQQEPPPDWVTMYGEEGARQRLAVARNGWAPASLAASGGKLAQQMMVGILRGRGYRNKVAVRNLNVKIALPAPTSQAHPGPELFAVKDIE